MMTIPAMLNTAGNDAELVAQSLAGNRDAFGRIVARYQSLICSLAYSATGSLSASEDVAQETFVSAWKQLRHLREPTQLRSWLCSIARHRIADTLHAQGRQPAHAAESIERIHDSLSAEPLPAEQVISKEEEAILWRSLERIPESYREPLVLFYREHQSIRSVAQELELSEDTVKQRLSRGRKLLHKEVLAFVEGALNRTNPGKAFTLGILASLPALATSTKAATLGAATAKGSALAKSASVVAWAGAVLGPVLGLLGAWLGTRAGIENTPSGRERGFKIKTSKIIWAYALGFDLLIGFMVYLSSRAGQSHGIFWVVAFTVVCIAFSAGLIAIVLWTNRRQRRIREEERRTADVTAHETCGAATDCFEYRSKASLLGLPLVHVCGGRCPDGKVAVARGWIAVGGLAYGALFSCGGVAVGAVSFGGVAIGAIAFGGLGVGGLVIAGVAFGLLAAGGAAAIGGLALSAACAIGWLGALGTSAMARHYAVSPHFALAIHANDQAARQFIRHYAFFLLASPKNFGTVIAFCWLPVVMALWQSLRARKRSRSDASR